MPNATAPRIRAGEAYIRITADNSALIRGLDAAKEALRSFGQTLKGIGTDMMQLSGVIALPLALSAKEFADFDDKVRILKAITGAAAAETSALLLRSRSRRAALNLRAWASIFPRSRTA